MSWILSVDVMDDVYVRSFVDLLCEVWPQIFRLITLQMFNTNNNNIKIITRWVFIFRFRCSWFDPLFGHIPTACSLLKEMINGLIYSSLGRDRDKSWYCTIEVTLHTSARLFCHIIKIYSSRKQTNVRFLLGRESLQHKEKKNN